MNVPWQKLLFSISFFVSLLGCTKSELSSDSKQTILSDGSYLNSSAITRAYWRNAGLGTLVTLLAAKDGKLTLPKSIQKGGDFGNRDSMATAVTLDLVAMVSNPVHPSGDFYFEAPILGPELTISNVTTALSWYLRWGFAEAPIKLSQNDFNQMVLNIEIICESCRTKTNSDVLNLIRNNASLVNSIREKVIAANPTLNLTDKVWTTPKAFWAWSDPVLNLSVGLKTVKETELGQVSAFYVNPLNSTQKIIPTSWTDDFNSSTSTPASDGGFQITFTYDDAGTHLIKPVFPTTTSDGITIPNDGISFQVSVDDANRLPLCISPLSISMRANVLNTVSLGSFCADQDPDNAYLTYSLESGATGLTITSTGLVKWTPPSQGTSGYNSPFSFRTTDSRSGMILSNGTVNVTPDKTPTFQSIATDYFFSEGLEGTFTVTATDDDGDPLNLTMAAVGGVMAGFPTGAGNLTNITRTGTSGSYSYQVKFTPSFLQSIGGDGTVQVALRLNYDNSSGASYDNTLFFDEHVVTFHIGNQDDPPLWLIQPTTVNAIEGTDLGGVLIGQVVDPSPNATAMTYSVVGASSYDECDWSANLSVTESAGSLYLHGAPAYYTRDECQFRISATDSNNLTSSSTTFTIESTNTNQPITLCTVGNACLAAPLTQVDGTEGTLMTLPLTQIFNDPDMDTTPTDGREHYTYACDIDLNSDTVYETSCASMTSLGFSFTQNILGGTANPLASSAGTYPIRLSVTDVGGATATHTFDLVIAEHATAMVLTQSLSTSLVLPGTSLTSYNVNEGSTYYLTLTATAASVRAIDIYNYTVTPSCSVVGGSGSCSATLLVAPSDLGGNGTKSFVFSVTPSYTEADSTYPATTKNYAVSFYVQKTDDATVFAQTSASFVVTNTNRAPTAIGLHKGTFGCTGSSENSNSDVFVICINGANDTKSGNTWTKTYSINLSNIDPDLTNGSYSYSLGGLAPGSVSVSDNVWNIKLPSCASPSTGTVTRTYTLTVSDGYGGTVTREVQIKVQKISASTSCM